MYHKLWQKANFEKGGTNIQKGIFQVLLNILSISLLSSVNAMSGYLRCKTDSHIVLGVDIFSYSGPSGILGSDGK